MSCVRQSFGARLAVAVGRIEVSTAGIVGDFESAAVDVGKTVDDPRAEIDPDRKMRRRVTLRTGRNAEVKHLLPRWQNAVADDVGEDAAEPWAAGEDICIRFDA